MQTQASKNNAPAKTTQNDSISLQKKENVNPFQTAFDNTFCPKTNPFQVALQKANIQPKLTIGQANNQYEQEANRIAEQVVSMPEADALQRKCADAIQAKISLQSLASQITPLDANFTQRKCADCATEEQIQGKFIQMKGEDNSASGQLESQINNSKGAGNPIDENTQSFMSERFGADFSGVRIHTGSQSVQMNQELGAKAFTVGNDIHFNQGEYNPSSQEGKRLLAHELTHTVQQNSAESIQRQDGVTTQDQVRCLDQLNQEERSNFGRIITQLQGSIPLVQAAIERSETRGFRFAGRVLNRSESRRVRLELRRLLGIIRQLLSFINSEPERLCFGNPPEVCGREVAGACFRRSENQIVLSDRILGGITEPEVISQTVTLIQEYVHLQQFASLMEDLLDRRHITEAADASFHREVEGWTYEALLFEILVPRDQTQPDECQRPSDQQEADRAPGTLEVRDGSSRRMSSRGSCYLGIESSTLDDAVDRVIDPSSAAAGRFEARIHRGYPDANGSLENVVVEVNSQNHILFGPNRIDIGSVSRASSIASIRSAMRRNHDVIAENLFPNAERGSRISIWVFVVRRGEIQGNFPYLLRVPELRTGDAMPEGDAPVERPIRTPSFDLN